MDKHDETVQYDAEPGAVRVRPIAEGEEVRLALEGESGAEADRGDANGNPAQLVGYTDDTEARLAECTRRQFRVSRCVLLKPCPQLASSDKTGSKAEAGDETRCEDGHPWHLVPVQFSKDLGCVSLHGKSVH